MLRPLRAPERRYTIGEAARLTGLTPRAMRLYEDRGLISSERGAYDIRHYSEAVIEDLRYIAAARRAGVSMAEIRELLALGRTAGEAARGRRLAEICNARMTDLTSQIQAVERLARTTESQLLAVTG